MGPKQQGSLTGNHQREVEAVIRHPPVDLVGQVRKANKILGGRSYSGHGAKKKS